MHDVRSYSTTEQSLVFALVEAFGRAIAAKPSLELALRLLRALRTGSSEIDRQVRQLAEIVFRLAIARSYLLSGHPEQHCARHRLN